MADNAPKFLPDRVIQARDLAVGDVIGIGDYPADVLQVTLSIWGHIIVRFGWDKYGTRHFQPTQMVGLLHRHDEPLPEVNIR